MNEAEIKTFAHHDKIRAVEKGTHLIARETFNALNSHEGGTLVIPAEATLRVRSNIGISTIQCEVALGEKVVDVGVFPDSFHCVDVKPIHQTD